MRYVCLNPRLLTTKESLIAHIRGNLPLSPECGANLDALYDELTCLFEPVSILCLRYERDGQSLYPHADGLYHMLEGAARHNKALRVEVLDIPAL